MKLFVSVIDQLSKSELIDTIAMLKGMTYSASLMESFEKSFQVIKRQSKRVFKFLAKTSDLEKEDFISEISDEMSRLQENVESEKTKLEHFELEQLQEEIRIEFSKYCGLNEQDSKDDELLSQKALARCISFRSIRNGSSGKS